MAANSRFPAETLDDIVRYYRNTCSMLPSAHDQLLLRPGEVHGGYDERVQGERNVSCGFGARWKPVNVRDIDGDEGSAIRVEIKNL
ncbi:hypothetical protein C1H46_013339 [Malus baccata]|uniref:Uncharacterized protein n=1 Tax=Malus baccata TaxID=106549 RepID=A0A540MQL4_MALBA|nr:hypothetical protein C1H46_013339 [Malus baccata]